MEENYVATPEPELSAAPPRNQGAAKFLQYLILAFGLSFAIFSIYEVNAYSLGPYQSRALFLLFPLALTFLMRAQTSLKTKPGVFSPGNLLDYTGAVLSVICCAYIVIEYEGLIRRMGSPTTMDLVMGTIGVVLVFETTRRVAGLALPVIAALFVLYAYAGNRLPTYLGGHGGYEFNRIVTQSFLTMEGIFGVALQVMFTYVFPFVLFGVVLEKVGALNFAIDMAHAIFGHLRGGPAKVAVVASGMVGMINGSAVANVVTAGSITIPMMKRIGFPPHVAGAIEAVASTGGQLMPPVMGAAAFMMAEFLGVPYLSVAKAALLPALLFYLGLFATIHFYSVRHNLGGVAQLGRGALMLKILKRNEMYLFCVPVAILITLMMNGYTTTRAVSISLAAALVSSLFVKEQRLTLRRIVEVLEKSAKDSISLCCASACVGIIIGLTLMTALGSRFTSIILDLSSGNMFAALFLVMVSSIILGLGLPTTICYVLLATLAGPALVQLGIEPIAAHLFILYFGMMSMVTPPDAMAAYAGAAIAGADMMKTGMTATVFSLSGYIVPFMFILSPALLLSGPIPNIALAIMTSSLGVILLGAAVAGHIKVNLKVWERILLLLAAIALIDPGLVTDLIGLVLLAIVLIKQYRPAAVANHAEVVKS